MRVLEIAYDRVSEETGSAYPAFRRRLVQYQYMRAELKAIRNRPPNRWDINIARAESL